MAEREGFEPSVGFPLHTLSKRAPSTTRTSLRTFRILHLRDTHNSQIANCDRNCDTPPNVLRSLTGTRALATYIARAAAIPLPMGESLQYIRRRFGSTIPTTARGWSNISEPLRSNGLSSGFRPADAAVDRRVAGSDPARGANLHQELTATLLSCCRRLYPKLYPLLAEGLTIDGSSDSSAQRPHGLSAQTSLAIKTPVLA
jgi:hypothetical protein